MNNDEKPVAYVSDTHCFGNYGQGWKLIFANFLILLVVVFVFGLIEAPFSGASDDEFSGEGGLLATLYGIFLVGPIGMSTSWVFLRAVRREEVRFLDMFAVFRRNYWNAVAAGLVKWIIVVLGLILFIVPGIIFACRLSLVDYLIIDRKLGALDAIQESWRMTRGHGLTVFGMGLLAIPIFIAGLLVLIVGVLVSAMWVSAAFAVLYHSICLREGEEGAGGLLRTH